MAYRYETSKDELMAELVRCAYQDRTAMMDSLASGVPLSEQMSEDELLSKMNDNDRDYYLECQRYCRDFIRMSHNLKLGVFHPSISPTGATK
ncbi:hypothetical protein [uncultured Sneathiella sp.]|jgi:AcrR family transcriptional regulator|uniref:hypothetical protein n=1 Tax=uncultured Sneathiella sp. TaxID=879315 RepID=UPI0030EBB254|tara:strand:- start:372 stop:647 length:276 start_codon:yes stop_codon:yes gene_type:complete